MTAVQPPRLAVALLNRFVPDNEPLAGDLVEEFRRRRSRLWFWRQVLVAIAIGSVQKAREGRPLALGPVDSTVSRDLHFACRSLRPSLTPISMTGSPVPGVGGLGLIALGLLVTAARPDAWAVPVYAVAGGILLGLALVVIRRRGLSSPSNGNRILFGDYEQKGH